MALRFILLCFVAYSFLSWFSVFPSWDHDLCTWKAGLQHLKAFFTVKGEHPKMLIRAGRDGHPSSPTRSAQGVIQSIPSQSPQVR